ncbi:uncharacterized protein LOC127865687 isoform X2 [Dreissena polymorpha]|uniref:uncharacterized protein LOC127865687 isoform X2 n=1 Tax=Dreissena polymorpha TaxID=45954 RepID=UPI00226419A5|nr:uncharacterized protein LOC127865687 isoform X2 [Dreissena polymorpha]
MLIDETEEDDLEETDHCSAYLIQAKSSDPFNKTTYLKMDTASDNFENHINENTQYFQNFNTMGDENVEPVSDCFKDNIRTLGLNSSVFVPEVYIKVEPASEYPEEYNVVSHIESHNETSKRDMEVMKHACVDTKDNFATACIDNIPKPTGIKEEPSSMNFKDHILIHDMKPLDNPTLSAIKANASSLGIIKHIAANPKMNLAGSIIKVERSLTYSDDHRDTYSMNTGILGARSPMHNADNYVRDTEKDCANSIRRIVEINNDLNYHIETNGVDTSEMDLETIEEIKQDIENLEREEIDHNAVSFLQLQREVKANISEDFLVHADNRKLSLFQLYTKGVAATVKLSIEVHCDFSCNMFVHRQPVPPTNGIWAGLPLLFDKCPYIMELCRRVQLHKVCPGNPDEEFVSFLPIGDGLYNSNLAKPLRVFEGNFNVSLGKTVDKSYSSTIRTSNCQLLVREADQCIKCKEYRSSLINRKQCLAETADPNGSEIKTKHDMMMSADDMTKKLQEQKERIMYLKRELNKLRKRCSNNKRSKSATKKVVCV